jgi:AcrR family transcriptional regulator
VKREELTDSGDKKELLLETAGALFAEHGFDGTSVRMIAEKSGMNIAMISYYFGSKEKLFEEFIGLKINYMREQLQALVENDTIDPWKKMEIVIEGYSQRIIKSSGAFHKMMMRELSLGQRNHITSLIEEKIMFNMRSVHSIFKEGVRKRVFRSDVDFSMLMSTMIGTITQTISSEKMFRCFLDLENKKKVKEMDANEQCKQVQKHLKKLFSCYLLIHPEKYKI